ncbi:MAG: PEP-CTERM sorting domain-containing protein [Verrucomicrobiales bacterium]
MCSFFRSHFVVTVLVLLFSLSNQSTLSGQTYLFVTEYNSGTLLAFDPVTGNSIPNLLPSSSFAPVGGSNQGVDGMIVDNQQRLWINRGDGTIWAAAQDFSSISQVADLPGSPSLLDATRNASHAFVSEFGQTTLYQVDLTTPSTVVAISGPIGASSFDGVRIGPDGRLYAVNNNGAIYAYDLNSSTWSTFLDLNVSGRAASQMEFGSDSQVYVSGVQGGSPAIFRYTLNIAGDYSSGLNAGSEVLIGSYGSSGNATGIRIGPDGRLYANAFNDGEVWRSNVGITEMEGSAFITGLQGPGSLSFYTIPEPSNLGLIFLSSLICVAWIRRRRQNAC